MSDKKKLDAYDSLEFRVRSNRMMVAMREDYRSFIISAVVFATILVAYMFFLKDHLPPGILDTILGITWAVSIVVGIASLLVLTVRFICFVMLYLLWTYRVRRDE
jgi:cytochrome bd-type quinol oxidase subunit 2